MKNKNLIFSFLTVVTLTIGAGCLWISCDDWTETEQVDYGVTTPDGQNPELYARYTQAVRNYKVANTMPYVYASTMDIAETEKKTFFVRCQIALMPSFWKMR